MSHYGDTPPAVVAAWEAEYDEVLWRHDRGLCRDGRGCPVIGCRYTTLFSLRGREGVIYEMMCIRYDLYRRIEWLAGLAPYDEAYARQWLEDAIRSHLIARGLKSEMEHKREAAGRLLAQGIQGDARRLFEGLWKRKHA